MTITYRHHALCYLFLRRSGPSEPGPKGGRRVGRIVAGAAASEHVPFYAGEQLSIPTETSLPLEHAHEESLQRLPTVTSVLRQCLFSRHPARL